MWARVCVCTFYYKANNNVIGRSREQRPHKYIYEIKKKTNIKKDWMLVVWRQKGIKNQTAIHPINNTLKQQKLNQKNVNWNSTSKMDEKKNKKMKKNSNQINWPVLYFQSMHLEAWKVRKISFEVFIKHEFYVLHKHTHTRLAIRRKRQNKHQ